MASSGAKKPRSSRALDSIELCGLPLAKVSYYEAIEVIITQAINGEGGWVLTVNLDILRRWVMEDHFKCLTSPVSVRIADGMPLVWASRLQGQSLPERIAGSDLIEGLSSEAGKQGLGIYLLGGAPGTALEASRVLSERCPGLRIAGTNCPPLGFENSSEQIYQIFERLDDAKPDIVYVALGSPKQEELIAQMRDYFPETWWLGIGASFSFLAGETRRAPLWVQRAGFEWLHRLTQEPRRLARRYLLHDLPFATRLFSSALIKRFK